MVFNCELCGFKSIEVKQGGGISEKGKRITLKVENEKDLTRDLFKGDTWSVKIPEVDLHLVEGTLGGLYTTVEGLLTSIHDKLKGANPFGSGDGPMNRKFIKFLDDLNELKEGNKEFTIILDDPLSNWYVYSSLYPDSDPQILIEEYERDEEQNDYLGINDMKVD